jgi:penicillin-binding protein 2
MNSFDIFGNPASERPLKPSAQELHPSYLEPVPELEQTVEGEELDAPRRFIGIGIALTAASIILAVQCYHLQIQNVQFNKAKAEGNSIRILTTLPDRGLIVDSGGDILARNTRQLALAVNPQGLPGKKADRQAVYETLKTKAGIAQKNIDFIEKHWLDGGGETYALKTNLSKDESLLYKEWFASSPGVSLVEVPIRQYTAGSSLGQLLGYVGTVDDQDVKDGAALNQRVGKSGLEKSYNIQLTGTPGKQKIEINAQGEEVRPLAGGTVADTKAGQTLKLSIDSKLQKVVGDALQHELARRTAKYGPMPKMGASAVVVDPATGAIKAMVSLPDYDGNLFAQGITQKDYSGLLDNPGNPLLNRAIQGQYPPGSTIKPLVGAAGLQSGIISKDFAWNTPYSINYGSFSFVDWKSHSGYNTNVERAIAESNDVFFYALGGGYPDKNIQGLGVDKENQYLEDFGLGSTLGIDIGGEASGLLGDQTYKKKTFNEDWYIGDTYHASIGQGYTLVTPLQMAMATATIANGGTLWQPSIGWSFIDPVTKKESLIPHKVVRQNFISPDNLATIRDGMRQTVVSGSARPLNNLQVKSAGKTGTAQFGAHNEYEHAWYIGYAPFDNPQMVFSIVIEAGGESFYSSEPVAEEILRGYFNEPLKDGQKLFSDTDVPADFVGEH